MKLLFDANISRALVDRLADEFPGSTHVSLVALEKASDREVWEFAAERDFVIVSKDEDFHQMAFLNGPPPRVVWVRLGNCSTDDIERSLRDSIERIKLFLASEFAAFLILDRTT